MNQEELREVAHQRAKTNELMSIIANFLIDAENWNCPLLKSHLRGSYDAAQNLTIHHSRVLTDALEKARSAT